ncbi:serine/threonine-protein kinase [Rubripirellula reticaptiva]|uniref:Serine/threonine-protein kinase PrkC n=1 Tax=Rubripirellula reticaptiva TaxID=2528013 RepID=A0A5C6EE47_9BACT|nr:serine/threonine-protein kinase [Rubripirellula reticaptiva]TWU48013.1 Serine/threonine-protein kinase PrkC [Rubripirellula reticaptiva]
MAVSLKVLRNDESTPATLRIGSRLDKYRILRRLGEGGFANVYAAQDLVEDRKVALKIPHNEFVSNTQSLDDLQREVRIMSRLRHPSILPLKDARFIGGHFVITFPLGVETLGDRMTRRISRQTAMDYAVQMISAVAYAHENSVLHRDIKPENFVLFPDQVIQLTDFGLARIEKGDHDISGSGTLGYISPEQAMGKPTYRSDVFSLGLVIYRLFSGAIPEYPFDSLPSYNRLRRGLSKDFVDLIRKAIEPAPTKRFRDGVAMHNALMKIRFPMTDRSVTLRSTTNADGYTRRVA